MVVNWNESRILFVLRNYKPIGKELIKIAEEFKKTFNVEISADGIRSAYRKFSIMKEEDIRDYEKNKYDVYQDVANPVGGSK